MNRIVLPIVLLALCAALPAGAQEGRIRHGVAIALDLDGDGRIDLRPRDPRAPVYRDIDEDGEAEATDWIGPADAFLALDLDEDGVITGSAELFGHDGMAGGFDSLRRYDTNGDGRITALDGGVWPYLRVWRDANGDGRSTPDELMTMEQARIELLELDRRGRGRGAVLRTGSYITRADDTRAALLMAEVRLSYDDGDVVPLDWALADLPQLPATGRLPDLRTAMESGAPGVRGLAGTVRALARRSFADIFLSDRNVEAEVTAILYRWAGVDGLDPAGLGPYIDARKAHFVARATGAAAEGGRHYSFWTAYEREVAFYNLLHGQMMPRLLLQGAGRELFAGRDVRFDEGAMRLRGVEGLDAARIGAVADYIGKHVLDRDRRKAWALVFRLVEAAVGVENLPPRDFTLLEDAIAGTGVKGGIGAVAADALVLMPLEIPGARQGNALLRGADIIDGALDRIMTEARARDPDSPSLGLSEFISAHAQTCCYAPELFTVNLTYNGYTVRDVTAAVNRSAHPMGRIGYSLILQAEKIVPVAGRKGVNDRYVMTAYYNGKKLDWVFAQVERQRRR